MDFFLWPGSLRIIGGVDEGGGGGVGSSVTAGLSSGHLGRTVSPPVRGRGEWKERGAFMDAITHRWARQKHEKYDNRELGKCLTVPHFHEHVWPYMAEGFLLRHTKSCGTTEVLLDPARPHVHDLVAASGKKKINTFMFIMFSDFHPGKVTVIVFCHSYHIFDDVGLHHAWSHTPLTLSYELQHQG